MNIDYLSLVEKVLVPLLGSSSQLISDLTSGAKSLATAKAQIGATLDIARQRLDSLDAAFASTDAAQDARVKAEIVEQKPEEPTKP